MKNKGSVLAKKIDEQLRYEQIMKSRYNIKENRKNKSKEKKK